MKLTAFAIVPPKGTEENPRVTNELQASVASRYSRSDDGLDAILAKVDLENPEQSIERIMKFVDFGHGSIADLTGTVGIAIDGISSVLAHRIFDFAQMGSGMQTSTRYVPVTVASLPDPVSLGFSPEIADRVFHVWTRAVETYQREFARIDKLADENPEIVRYPEGITDKARTRIRRNFALDQTRFYLPFSIKTNVVMVASASTWAFILTGLLGCPEKEAGVVARAVIGKLQPYFPNLIRYARQMEGFDRELATEAEEGANRSVANISTLPVLTQASVTLPPGVILDEAALETAMAHRSAKYGRRDRFGRSVRQTAVAVRWDGMAIAQVRDLIRHRTGRRFCPMSHEGFFLPDTVQRDEGLVNEVTSLIAEIKRACGVRSGMHAYALLFGSQTSFEHTTTLDNFTYEAELRTDKGADVYYAQHLRDAVMAIDRGLPGYARFVRLGESQPE